MSRRASTSEPAFGSDSFLDVTANLVGVLIILIVLVGLRVAKAPPQAAALDGEIQRRLSSIQSEMHDFEAERFELEQRLDDIRGNLARKQTALVELTAADSEVAGTIRALAQQLGVEKEQLRTQDAELAQTRPQLVSLTEDLKNVQVGGGAARTLEHRSPIGRRVDAREIHFELQAGRVSFIDLAELHDRAWANVNATWEGQRNRGPVSGTVGPVGSFRLQFAVVRKSMSATESAFYRTQDFLQWRLVPSQPVRGEPTDVATQPGSKLDSVLARYSPNKYAVTIWTYPDSFSAFRELRDHLVDRGFSVAGRPLPFGIPIGGGPGGVASFAQ